MAQIFRPYDDPGTPSLFRHPPWRQRNWDEIPGNWDDIPGNWDQTGETQEPTP